LKLKNTMKKTTQLRRLLRPSQLSFLMEAHNGISAKIVEETGFEGIWASGFSISAGLGVRDSNEVSWTQALEMVEFMADATTIPILMDGDTGFGNFNNLRRLIQKLEQRGVAGVCIEDKIFPKKNSFIQSESQELEDIDVFCGKIKAAKDTQRDDDFVLVARTESFIVGHSLATAIDRCRAYSKAGADAILVHSRKDTAQEIEAFMKEWDESYPIVVVPTSYYNASTDLLRNMGVSMAIWANHNVRAAVTAMQNICREIYQTQSISTSESTIASIQEIFRLQNTDELLKAEQQYLPNGKNGNGSKPT